MSSDSTISVLHQGPVAVVTFARPPGNWMSVAALRLLIEQLEHLALDSDTTKCVVLTGGVDGLFVAHADFDDLAQWRSVPDAAAEGLDVWRRATNLLERMPQPTVAAIDGQAWGGGCELALACTFRVGSPRAHLALPEVSVGVIPGAGGTQRLAKLINPALAAEVILSGKIVKAEAALAAGLLNAVLPGEPFVDAVVAWCGRFTRHPSSSLVAAKRAIVERDMAVIDAGLELERTLFVELNESEEARRRNAAYQRPGAAADAEKSL